MADSSIDWQTATLVATVIGAIIAIIISILAYRKIDREANRTNAEASETIAKLVLRVMALENKIGLLESENKTLRTRIVELESKLPNEGK